MADSSHRSFQSKKQHVRPRSRRRWSLSRLFGRHSPRAMITGGLVGVTAFVALNVVVVLLVYGYFQAFDLVLPGVHVGDVRLGGLSVERATLALHDAWTDGQGITITDGQRTWQAPPAEFGLALDPAATAQRAFEIGHGRGVFAEIGTLIGSMLHGRTVSPVARIDAETARAGLGDWADEFYIAPQDATIRINEGQVLVMPGVPGYELDIERTLAVLVADPGGAMQEGAMPLVMTQVPPAVSDVSAVAAEAERMLSSELVIQGYDPVSDDTVQWTASREVIAGWLTVTAGEAGPQIVASEPQIEAYLEELDTQLGEGRYFDAAESAAAITGALQAGEAAATLIVKHKPTAYTVDYGDTLTSISWKVGVPYWRILEANPGLEQDTLAVGQVITIPSKDDLLPLPVVPGKRIVVGIDQQRLWAYEDGALVYEYVISTGIDRSPTQPGVFQVQEHDPMAYASVWDLHMPNFISIYESWPGFMNGFHGLPSRDGGQVLWADSLGHKTSFGCIILDLDDAETLYNWAEDGVVVEIVE